MRRNYDPNNFNNNNQFFEENTFNQQPYYENTPEFINQNYQQNSYQEFPQTSQSYDYQFDSEFNDFCGFNDNLMEQKFIDNESQEMLEFRLMQDLIKIMPYDQAEKKVHEIFTAKQQEFFEEVEYFPIKKINENHLTTSQVLTSVREKYNYTTVGNTLHIKNNLNILHSSENEEYEIEGLEIREDVKPIRTPVVKSMLMAQNFVPPLTINTEVDMTEILLQQKKLKSLTTGSQEKFSTISFVVKAISIALESYPKLNSFYDPETNELVIKKSHHIGIATETSDGLVIPVIKYVEQLSLKHLSDNINQMNLKLREGTLYDYDIQGSTITIVNYGAIGAVQAVPTIYYPNSSVIGVGRIIRKPIVIKGDKLVIRSIMNLTVTVDQRIIDSAEAGIFLSKLQQILESPDLIILS